MSLYPITLCVYSPTRYLFPLIPAVLLRSLVGVVAKGNSVACRRSFNSRRRRRRILFFWWLSFGFLRKEAPHFGLLGWDQITPVSLTVVSLEKTSKCEAEAYVHLSCQDFFFFQLPVSQRRSATNRYSDSCYSSQSQVRREWRDHVGEACIREPFRTSRKKNSASQIFIVYLFLKRINVHRIQKTQRGKIYFLLFQLNMLNVSSVLKTGLGVNHNAIDDDIKFSSVFLCCRRNTVTPRIW